MKARIFDVVLHNVPAGKSPATQLEEQINAFLKNHPNLQAVSTHMNTLTIPAEAIEPGVEAKKTAIILFATIFYNG